MFLSVGMAAQSGYKVGVTAAPGIPFSQAGEEHVQLDKAIIYFRGFTDKWLDEYNKVPLASYQYLYSFYKEVEMPVYAPTQLPVYFFFTEFDNQNRSNILDNLATMMPDLFDFSTDEATTKEVLREKFANRNFIRRNINKRDLDKLNMNIRVWQDDKELDINKIVVEFRWIKDKENNQEILAAELFIHFDLNFTRAGQSVVRINHAVPTYFQQAEDLRYYSPFHIGSGRTWKGNIDSLYLVREALDASLSLPYYFDAATYSYDYDKEVVVLTNHEPEKNEKIGLYTYRMANCGCYAGDAVPEKLYFPSALTNVTASNSWMLPGNKAGRCADFSQGVTTVKWVPDLEYGFAPDMGVNERPLDQQLHSGEVVQSILSNECDNAGDPYLSYTAGFSPWLAFDAGLDSVDFGKAKIAGIFGTSSAWCTQSDKQGIGEYLEFTITQPVSLMKFFTGLQSDASSYQKYNRVKLFELVHMGGTLRKDLYFSDIVTSSYEQPLEPGTYRLYIREVFEGQRPDITCFSAVRMGFHFNDSWFDTQFKVF